MILHHRHAAPKGIGNAARPLLHDMRQLVAQQKLPVRRMGIVLAGCEMDIRSPRKRDSADRGRFGSHMYAHIGEAGFKRCLHLGLYVAG
jgi:hypothetical protein